MNPTHLADDVYQRITDEVRAIHASEIEALRAHIQRKANSTSDVIALEEFTRQELQLIVAGLFNRLFNEIVWTAFFKPALEAAQASACPSPHTPPTNGSSLVPPALPQQPRQPMGFQARRK